VKFACEAPARSPQLAFTVIKAVIIVKGQVDVIRQVFCDYKNKS
jgi:hypothetical protein